jgi:hypothetical protein
VKIDRWYNESSRERERERERDLQVVECRVFVIISSFIMELLALFKMTFAVVCFSCLAMKNIKFSGCHCIDIIHVIKLCASFVSSEKYIHEREWERNSENISNVSITIVNQVFKYFN